MNPVSSYTDSAEQRNWRDRCINDARANYDEALKKVTETAADLRNIEDDMIDATSDPETAKDHVAMYSDLFKKATEQLIELHRWKTILKAEYGVDP